MATGATRNSWTATGIPGAVTPALGSSRPLRELGHTVPLATLAGIAREVLVQEEPPGACGQVGAEAARELHGHGDRACDLSRDSQEAARGAQLELDAAQRPRVTPRRPGHAAHGLRPAVAPHEPSLDHVPADADGEGVHGEVVAEAGRE